MGPYFPLGKIVQKPPQPLSRAHEVTHETGSANVPVAAGFSNTITTSVKPHLQGTEVEANHRCLLPSTGTSTSMQW